MNSIFHRRSIRKYQEKEVEQEKLDWILKAAMAAPTTANQQPWEFTIVRKKEVIEELSKASPYTGCAGKAPVVIVVSYRMKNLPCPDWTQIDCAIAMENIWLETDALGLGGVWLGIAPVEERMKVVDEIIGNREGIRSFSLFALGYPDEEKTLEENYHYDSSRVRYID